MVPLLSHDKREISRQAARSLERLWPRLDRDFRGHTDPDDWAAYRTRLESHFEALFFALIQLYGSQYDFFYHLESVASMTARMWISRPSDLKKLDADREGCPDWFQSQHMIGGVCYVDLFSRTLDSLRNKIAYFKELGLTYLHLMPLFLSPEGNSDGGYAVSNYHEVNPSLGSMDDLRELAAELRRNGISLTLDFVLNHTSDEHVWAQRARENEEEYRSYYWIFSDRVLPDHYGETLRDIFPDVRPGSFTFVPDLNSWVWTTFNSFQWDLNYSNPAVFGCMAEEMVRLANCGAEILRFDALAFIWKEMGTSCENLPQAHLLIRAFNAVARISCPAVLFKSEAIVHPDEVIKYVGEDECRLSYNPLLMALLWEALATREVRMLQAAARERFRLPAHCSWVNYIRSHDDIGWTFDDADAARLGINGFDHRQFLNAFYTGRFPGSFARGLPFQENSRTGDARISGTTASLAGVENAIQDGDDVALGLAIARVLLLHAVVYSIGGVPLLYLGDEVGTVNGYDYASDASKSRDSRWVHRPAADWERIARRTDSQSIEGKIFTGLSTLAAARMKCPALAGNTMDAIDTGNPHVFAYVRRHDESHLLAFCNFSESEQHVSWNLLAVPGMGYHFRDAVSGKQLIAEQDLILPGYGFVWLVSDS